MHLVWAPQVVRDLTAIHAYIAKFDPNAAVRVIREIRTSALTLSDMPEVGRPGRWPGTRELVVRRFPYVVPYRISGEEIQIIAVMHTSRRWPEDLPT